MPIKGADKVKRNMRATFEKIAGPMTERCLTVVLITGGAVADAHTPQDTGTLVNSRFRWVARQGDGWTGRYGYTASYAAAVHALDAKLKGQPRSSVESFNTKKGVAFESNSGNFWDPDGEPHWLQHAFEDEAKADIEAAIAREMKL